MYSPGQDAPSDSTDWFAQNDPSKLPPSVAATGTGAGTGTGTGAGNTPPSQAAGNVTYTKDPTTGNYRGSDGNLYSYDPVTGVYRPIAGGTGSAGSAAISGSLIEPFTESFKAPKPIDLGGPGGLPITPTFTPPNFQAPTAQSVLSDPGYQFRLGQGEQALQQSAAGQGLINTGGTLKDVLQYGQNFASNEFQNAWNRNLDVYNTAFQSAAAAFAPQMAGYTTQANLIPGINQNSYMNAYNKWLSDYSQYRNQKLDTFNMQDTVATQ